MSLLEIYDHERDPNKIKEAFFEAMTFIAVLALIFYISTYF